MSSLSDERLARLHRQFLDAAGRYPTFHFAAVCEIQNPAWPEVLVGEDRYLGLAANAWHELLNKPLGQCFSPFSTEWLWFGGRLWECAFFDDGKPWDDLQAQLAHVESAMDEFHRLAAEAAGTFNLPDQNPDREFPVKTTPAATWLAQVCDLLAWKDRTAQRLLVRFDANAFIQSARTVEKLTEVQEALRKAFANAPIPLLEDQDIQDASGLVALIDALYQYVRWVHFPDSARRILGHLRDGRNPATRIPGFPTVAWKKLPSDYPPLTNDPGSDLSALSQWAQSKAGLGSADSTTPPAVQPKQRAERGAADSPPQESRPLPYSLCNAHQKLQQALSHVIDMRQRNPIPDSRELLKPIGQFVYEWNQISERAQELQRRAGFVASQCKEGTAYGIAKAKARKLGLPRRLPKPPGQSVLDAALLRPFEELHSNRDLLRALPLAQTVEKELRELRAVTKQHKRFLGKAHRDAYERWHTACVDICERAENLKADGCYLLLSVAQSQRENTDDGCNPVLGIWSTKIREAIEALVDWAKSESPSACETESREGDDASNGLDPDLQRRFMEMAVEEARRCKPEDGRVHPQVGVVVVKGGVVLATAYRGELANGEHAEFTALERKLRDETVAGATVYTTLEPCTSRNHPKVPCADRLIERRVKRVVIGMHDPHRTVDGKGWARLHDARIATAAFSDDLKDKIEEMNRDFIRHCQKMNKESDTREAEGPPQPTDIETVSDWFHTLERGDKVANIPVPKGSGSLAQGIRDGNENSAPRYPEVYTAQDDAARLIEQHFGVWVTKDPDVVARAVRAIANYLNYATNDVWQMGFIKFYTALRQMLEVKLQEGGQATTAPPLVTGADRSNGGGGADS